MSTPTRSTKLSPAPSSHEEISAPTIILNDCHGVNIYASPGDGPGASSRPPVSRNDEEETRIHIALSGHAHESTRPPGSPRRYRGPNGCFHRGRPASPRFPRRLPRSYSPRPGQHRVQFQAPPSPFNSFPAPQTRYTNFLHSARPHPNIPSFWTAGAREQPHPNSTASTDSDADADDTPSVPAAYTRPAHVLRPGARYPYIPHLRNPNARTWIPVNPSAAQWGPLGYSTPSPTESDVDDTAAVSDHDTDEDTRFLRQGQGGGAHSRRYGGPRGVAGVARGRFGDGHDPVSMTETEREGYAARLASVYEQAVRTDLRRAPLVVQGSNGGRQNGRVTRRGEASMEEGRAEGVQSRNSGSSEETLVEREPVDGREGDEGHPVSANGTAY